MFPVFAKAREKARQSSCSSNLKQIGLAVAQYVQDYDEMYPWSEANEQAYCFVRLAPYMKNEQILRCPSDPNPQRTFQGIGGATGAATSYYPVQGDSTADPAGAYWGIFSSAEPSVSMTSDTIMVGERQTGELDWHITRNDDTQTTTSNGSVATNLDASDRVTDRHNEGANYLFADSHVKWFKRTKSATDHSAANATVNGINYYYFWRSAPGK